MPSKAPPVFKPNNTLPILPRMGPAAYNPPSLQQKPVRPAAPPVFRPVLPVASLFSSGASGITQQMTIQRSRKGVEGGKGGLGYGDVGGGDQELNQKALQRAGLKGVKGHKKGKQGSGVSGQTKKETAAFVEARKEIREEQKAQTQGCRKFHKRTNRGEKCPSCGKVVDDTMV